ncbi:MAG: DUF460 domain-containing protein [Candidatus Heimdallarchaeota archaeon]|nr:DUF460 domain-containing protein [Candidatus Heimdallarchaeota archaeon]
MSSSESDEEVRVAIELIDDEAKGREWNNAPLSKLLAIIKKYKPIYVGTDNPNEIISSNVSIAEFCRKLPSETSLVHVNLLANGNTIALRELLRLNQIPIRHKLTPLKTAKMLNILLRKGIGMKLEPFHNETMIKIGQPRRHRKGGWSQARFERTNEEVVLAKARELEILLKRNECAYDSNIQQTKYGAKQGRFHIFEERRKIDQILSTFSSFPAKIRIWSPAKQIITHQPIHNKDSKLTLLYDPGELIVGIDPGMETGIAIINLDGSILLLKSKKSMTRSELTTLISSYGTPLIIASDIPHPPNLVKKIAAIYSSKISSPKQELSVNEKRIITDSVEMKMNTHEQDALAGALYAFAQYKSIFAKVLNDPDLNDKEKMQTKKLIVLGLSLAEAKIACKIQKIETGKVEISPKPEKYNEIIQSLNHNLQMLNKNLTFYIADNERKEKQIANLNNQIQRMKYRKEKEESILTKRILEKEIVRNKNIIIDALKIEKSKLENSIDLFRKRINDLEQMLWISLESGGYPIKVIEVFSINDIDNLIRTKGIEDGDILYVHDPTGTGIQAMKMVIKFDLRIIFTKRGEFPLNIQEILYEHNIPFISAKKYDLRILDTIALVTKNNLELALNDFAEIRERREKRKKSVRIEKEITNYYYEREKEIQKSTPDYSNYEPEDDEGSYL